MDDINRKYLVASLQGRNAHISFEDTIKDFPTDYCNKKISGIQYSCWDLLEHIRIAQWDILDFIVNPGKFQPKKKKVRIAEVMAKISIYFLHLWYGQRFIDGNNFEVGLYKRP